MLRRNQRSESSFTNFANDDGHEKSNSISFYRRKIVYKLRELSGFISRKRLSAPLLCLLCFLLLWLANGISLFNSTQLSTQPAKSKLSGHYDLFVGVLTAPDHFYKRRILRDTWIRLGRSGDVLPANARVIHRFMVGQLAHIDNREEIEKRLLEEALEYGDIVRLQDVIDTYDHLPHKVLSMMTWLADQRSFTFSYYLKSDDDSYVRVDRLLAHLQYLNLSSVYWGFFNYGASKTRYNGTQHARKKQLAIKWEDPIFNESHYPPYAVGSAYVLSSDLVDRIVSTHRALYKEPPSRMEDASIGIYLDNSAGEINRVEVWWNTIPAVRSGSRSFVCLESMIVRSHVHDVKLMREWHRSYEKCGLMCCTKCENCTTDDVEPWSPDVALRMDYTPNQLRWIGKRKETELNRLRSAVRRLRAERAHLT